MSFFAIGSFFYNIQYYVWKPTRPTGGAAAFLLPVEGDIEAQEGARTEATGEHVLSLLSQKNYQAGIFGSIFQV